MNDNCLLTLVKDSKPASYLLTCLRLTGILRGHRVLVRCRTDRKESIFKIIRELLLDFIGAVDTTWLLTLF